MRTKDYVAMSIIPLIMAISGMFVIFSGKSDKVVFWSLVAIISISFVCTHFLSKYMGWYDIPKNKSEEN